MTKEGVGRAADSEATQKKIADIAKTLMSKDPKLKPEDAIKAARVLLFKKGKNQEAKIIENLSFNFNPSFEIKEGVDGKAWLNIGGMALEEGVSRNNNKYTFENLKENDGREFKWLFGHPDHDAEEHIIGLGKLSLQEGKLFHEGKIRNTAKHRDVVEMVRDGFLGPSIHASAKEVSFEEGVYNVKGLEIEGVGLVAFQGVKSASIDYALAESFEKAESSKEDVTENMEETKMVEEIKVKEEEQPKQEEPVAEVPKEEPKEEPAAQETFSVEDIKMLKEELATLKNAKKNELVESIVKINSSLVKEELLKESDERLKLVLEYETKLAGKTESVAVVENTEEKTEEFAIAENGDYTMTKEMYDKFNTELRERVR